MVYGIAAELNCQKCHVWNNHGHMTTLPMAVPDVEILAVRFLARDSIYAIARSLLMPIRPSVCPSVCPAVCPAVCHTGGSLKDGYS